MGRPLKKDVRGTDAIGQPNLANTGIRVSGYFGGALGAKTYFVIKQRGAKTFVVAKQETFTANTTSGGFTLTSMSDQVEVTVGDELSGTGIATGARVVSIDSATQVTMDKAATSAQTGTTVTHHGALQIGVLVTGTPAANGEIQMTGSTTGQENANLVSIAKITKRVATAFNGTRYTWYLESDSSADYIVLTAI
jgi:hypothetical protein